MYSTISAIPWPSTSHLFHHGFLGGYTFILQLGCFGFDFTSFVIACCKAGLLLALEICCYLSFSLLEVAV